MEYRHLGNSGLKVSVLCIGTQTFGIWKDVGSIGYDQAKPLIDLAIDSGINFFDTADIYGNDSWGRHESESILGKAIASKRKNLIISTKVRYLGPGLSRKNIIERCNDSLKALGTDYIDLYIMHGFDKNTPLEETLKALDDLIRQGKVRYIGCSNFSSWHVMKGLWISDKLNLEKFIALQLYYSPGAREIELEMVPLCLDQGLGIMAYSPLSGGFFTGKYSRTKPKPENSRHSNAENPALAFSPIDEEKGYDILDELEKIAKNNGKSISQSSLNYILNKPAVSSVIIGIRKLEQLKDNLGSVGWRMDEEEKQRLDEIGKPALFYPYWHQKIMESFN